MHGVGKPGHGTVFALSKTPASFNLSFGFPFSSISGSGGPGNDQLAASEHLSRKLNWSSANGYLLGHAISKNRNN